MRKARAKRKAIKRAADAVVEYAIVSLRPEFLLWDKHVNMGIAELVWNAYSLGADQAPVAAPSSDDMASLIKRLAEVRQTKWPDEKFLVMGLNVRHEHGDLVFRFDLTWNEGESFQPCEIAWDPRGVGEEVVN